MYGVWCLYEHTIVPHLPGCITSSRCHKHRGLGSISSVDIILYVNFLANIMCLLCSIHSQTVVFVPIVAVHSDWRNVITIHSYMGRQLLLCHSLCRSTLHSIHRFIMIIEIWIHIIQKSVISYTGPPSI